MWRILSACCGLLLCHAAQAQNFAPNYNSASTNWSGFYAGVHAGVAASSVHAINSLSGLSDRAQSGGLQGGLLTGFNYQLGSVIVGAEIDASLTGFEGHHAPIIGAIDSKISWGASARARLGLPLDAILLYGTGGVALANTNISLLNLGSSADIQTGWQIGTGLEAQIWAGWRLRGEYLYTKMNETRFALPNGNFYDVSSGTHTLRAAVIVRFGL